MNFLLSLYCIFLFQLNPKDVKLNDFVMQFSYQHEVNDYSNLFTDDEKQKLVKKLKQIKKENNISYIIVTVDNLDGNEVYRVASSMLEKWKKDVNSISKRPSDAGILFFFSKNDYLAYIATGKETDLYLPHTKIKEIIEIDVVPSLRHGDYYTGTVHGIDALHQYLGENFHFSKKIDFTSNIYLLALVAFISAVLGIRFFKRR